MRFAVNKTKIIIFSSLNFNKKDDKFKESYLATIGVDFVKYLIKLTLFLRDLKQ